MAENAEENNVTPINQDAVVEDPTGYMDLQQRRIDNLRAELERRDKESKEEPLTLEQAMEKLKPDEGYKPVYKIRPMNRADFKKLIDMIRRVRGHEGFQEAIASKDQAQMMNAGLEMLLDELEDEFVPWLADLAQKEPEKWDEEPFGADFDVLNDLKANKDFLKGLRSATYFVMSGKRLFGK